MPGKVRAGSAGPFLFFWTCVLQSWLTQLVPPIFSRKSAGGFDDLAMFVTGHATASGEPVTPSTAMRCPTVFACVKVISESLAQMPCHLYRRDSNGQKERATDNPLYRLLHDAPNGWTSAAEFRLNMQLQMLLHGNSYAFINRAGGVIRELVQLPSDSVSVEVDERTLEPRYKVSNADGSQAVYDRRQILHLRTIGTDLHVGDSPISQAREAIGLCLALEKHAGKLFGNGARPSGLLKHPRKVAPEVLKKLKESFSAAYSGGENSGRTPILEDGMEFDPLQFSSVDSQFLEMRRHQIAEIARVFRVPLSLIFELERVTHANAESLGQQFVTFTLLPILHIWQGAIQRTLLADEDDDLFVEFMVDDLVRADIVGRFQAYNLAVINGLLSPNEIRAMENRSPYEGGDAFRAQLNTTPAGVDDAA